MIRKQLPSQWMLNEVMNLASSLALCRRLGYDDSPPECYEIVRNALEMMSNHLSEAISQQPRAFLYTEQMSIDLAVSCLKRLDHKEAERELVDAICDLINMTVEEQTIAEQQLAESAADSE